MKGLDLLKEELISMGYTKAQADSKVVPAVLSICANNPQMLEIANAEAELKTAVAQCSEYMDLCNSLKEECTKLKQEMQEMHIDRSARAYYAEVEAMCNESDAKIERFMNALQNGETAEGRDGLRKAQMFVQNVNIDSKYDNTAYIIGLSAILSNGAIEPIEELSKINPKIDRGRNHNKRLQWADMPTI